MRESPGRITVLIVEDEDLCARAVRRLLFREPDLEWAGRLACADRLRDEAEAIHPDVILLDLGMPGTPALDALRQVAEALPETRFIIFTGECREHAVMQALAAGARGFVWKGDDAAELAAAIRAVAAGRFYASATLRGGAPAAGPPCGENGPTGHSTPDGPP